LSNASLFAFVLLKAALMTGLGPALALAWLVTKLRFVEFGFEQVPAGVRRCVMVCLLCGRERPLCDCDVAWLEARAKLQLNTERWIEETRQDQRAQMALDATTKCATR
jgi:hypothetical protein